MLVLQKNKVAIVPIRDPDKIGSLWVPDIAKERTDQGIVKYIGPDCKFAKVGMYVIFSGYSGTVIAIEDAEQHLLEEVIVLPEEFIYAEIIDDIEVDVPGLYFKGAEGEYWQATYEQAMMLIGRAVGKSQWRRNIDVKDERIKREEYEKLKGGT